MVELQHEEMSVAQTMKIAAAARRCGLIVMGAYGRMRITERIFGGVTHDMLSNLSIPLLLRH
jgi:nucleotide-binding universal stress UspA family protein